MATERRVGAVFDPDPWQWGLRGDPHVWWHMAEVLSAEPFPQTEAQLVALIERTFEDFTGAPWSTPEPFYLEQYAHGGMSSGIVSPDWWRQTGLPLLLERFAAAGS